MRNNPLADVAELADALRSGRSSRKGVWVRLPPSAPLNNREYSRLFCFKPATSAINGCDKIMASVV